MGLEVQCNIKALQIKERVFLHDCINSWVLDGETFLLLKLAAVKATSESSVKKWNLWITKSLQPLLYWSLSSGAKISFGYGSSPICLDLRILNAQIVKYIHPWSPSPHHSCKHNTIRWGIPCLKNAINFHVTVFSQLCFNNRQSTEMWVVSGLSCGITFI